MSYDYNASTGTHSPSSNRDSAQQRARLPKCPSCGHLLTHDDLLVIHRDIDLRPCGFDINFAREFVSKRVGNVENDDQGADSGTLATHKPEMDEAVDAVRRLIDIINKLGAQLSSSLALQEDAQAELKIAKSNLVLAEANADALEETLRRKRDSSSTSRSRPDYYAGSIGHNRTSSNISSFSSALPTPMFTNGFNSPKIDEDDQVERVEETPLQPQTQGSRFWRLGGKKKINNPPPSSSQTFFFPGSSPSNSKARPDSYMPLTPTTSIGGVSSERQSPLRAFSDVTPLSGESERLAELTATLSQLSEQVHDLEANNTILNSDNVALSASNEKLRGEKEELLKNYQDLQEEMENLSAVLFEEANNLVSQERQQRAEEKEGFEKRIDNLEKEILSLKDRLIAMEKEREEEYTPRGTPFASSGKESTPSIISSSSIDTKDTTQGIRPKRSRWFSFGRSADKVEKPVLAALPPMPPTPTVEGPIKSPRERTVSAPISPTRTRTPIPRVPSTSSLSTSNKSVPPSPILSQLDPTSSDDSITPPNGSSSLPDDVSSDFLSPESSRRQKHKPSPLSWVGTSKDKSLPVPFPSASLSIPPASPWNDRPLSIASSRSLPNTPTPSSDAKKATKKRSMLFFNSNSSSNSEKGARPVPTRAQSDYPRRKVSDVAPTLKLDFEKTDRPFPSSKSENFMTEVESQGVADDLMRDIISLGRERGYADVFQPKDNFS